MRVIDTKTELESKINSKKYLNYVLRQECRQFFTNYNKIALYIQHESMSYCLS